MFVGSSSTSAFTPRAASSAIAARLRSPGESERPGREHVVGAERELREQRARLARREPALGDEAVEQALVARERAGALRQLAEHGARAEPALARRERQLTEQRPQERRLAGAVAAEQRKPVAVP